MQEVALEEINIFDPLSWPSFFIEQFQTNDIFTGLIAVSFIGVLAYVGRTGYKSAWSWMKRAFLVELTVFSEDPMFNYLKLFLSQTDYVKNKCRRLTLSTNHDNETEYGPAVVPHHEGSATIKNSFILSPTAGYHLLFYKGNPILFHREMEDRKEGMAVTNTRKESIKMTYFGRGRALIYDLVREIQKQRGDMDTIRIYSGQRFWEYRCDRKTRGLDTLFLPKAQKSRIVNDIQWFLNNEEWYKERGLPYHRGYLFSGPGGTGKTSMIRALASYFGMNIGILNINGISSDEDIIGLVAQIPRQTFLVIEDIDAAMNSKPRKEKESPDMPGVSLSGILNALDGITTPDGLLVFMTTNHPEKLDPAILRAGRVDIHEQFKLACPEVMADMFARYYPHEIDRLPEFLGQYGNQNLVTADLQNMFFVHNDNVDELISRGKNYGSK